MSRLSFDVRLRGRAAPRAPCPPVVRLMLAVLAIWGAGVAIVTLIIWCAP